MPYDDPDPSDPQMLVGVMLPSGAEAMRDMAYVVAEEFARFGRTREQILSLFCNPFYAAAHGAYQALGADETASIVDECLAIWGRVRLVDRDAAAVSTERAQPQDAASDTASPSPEAVTKTEKR